MPNGKQPPFISPDSVRLALDTLLYSSSDKKTSLLSLLLVDEFLAQPDLPYSSLSREFALSQILTSAIIAEFARHRGVFERSLPQSNISREIVFEMIRLDAESASPDLIGWSWLYHHFVHIELNLHAPEFCKLVAIEERTLRRYQQYTIKRLTNILIEQERSARIRQRKRRLLSELPGVATFTTQLLREEVSSYVNRMLHEANPRHFYITGSRGVGKTTFVESIVQRQIEIDQIDQLIWIQMPVSVEYIHYYLIERLMPLESQISLRDYLIIHRTVVVLDDADLLFNSLPHVRSLLQMLSQAAVFITCSAYMSIPDTIEVTLQEFSEADMRIYANHILTATRYSSPSIDDVHQHLHDVWERVGGNPLATQMVIRNLPYFDLKSINDALGINAIYNRIFQVLDEKARTAWLILILMPPGAIELDTLYYLWPEDITRDGIGNLLQHHIVEAVSDPLRYQLVNAARHYIEDVYRQDSYVSKMVHRLLQGFDNQTTTRRSNVYLSLVEHLLLADWLVLDHDVRNKWIATWWKEGVKHQHWSIWRILLESQINHQPIDIDICRGYAICLRQLGEWELAQQTIEGILSETGRKGWFVEQGEAMLQLTTILRYQGQYEKATEILSRVEKIATRLNSEALWTSLATEQIQIAIDLGDPQTAESFIAKLPDTSQGYALKSEIYFLRGDYQQSRAYAELAIRYAENNFTFRARIYTLMGRICEQENDLEGAQDNFSWALMILEQHDDVFALSRAQANLGALFLQTAHYEEAAALLSAAEKIQLQLGDQVALAVIQHNLRLLDIAISN